MNALIQTIDRRERISDGTSICNDCSQIIAEGKSFTTLVHPAPDAPLYCNICEDCQNEQTRGDVTIAVVVVGFTIATLALLAAVLAG